MPYLGLGAEISLVGYVLKTPPVGFLDVPLVIQYDFGYVITGIFSKIHLDIAIITTTTTIEEHYIIRTCHRCRDTFIMQHAYGRRLVALDINI